MSIRELLPVKSNCGKCFNNVMGLQKFVQDRSDGNDHFFHEPRSFTIMSPNVIKIWATIIHFELSKIWSSITHEWSAIIYNHNYFIFSVNFSWFSPINFQINLKTFFAGNFLWIFAIFLQKLKIFKRSLISPAKNI